MAKITNDRFIDKLLISLHDNFGYDISVTRYMRVNEIVDENNNSISQVCNSYDVCVWAKYTTNLKGKEVIKNVPDKYKFRNKTQMSLFLIELLNKSNDEMGQAT